MIVTAGMDLPWDAGLFSCGAGAVMIVTSSAQAPPQTATPVEVVRQPGGVDLTAALAALRERGIRALLCEGGPLLAGSLVELGLVDELFITIAAKLGGGGGPRMIEGLPAGSIDLELRWLLREGDELFARYAVAAPGD